MNLSGEAVAPLVRFHQVPLENTLIVYDELALPLGRLRLLGKGSDGGHNGMKSLISHLGTPQFPRLRLGIGPKPPMWNQADFVLSRFAKADQAQVSEMIEAAAVAIRTFVDDGLERAMNRVNAGAGDRG
ncbi:MAG: peptidyl-tRNA hydrolase [Proteobacteria bacterium]|nr:peptidyl-tRNA hydrolase [Pseudomonadota bacterium]